MIAAIICGTARTLVFLVQLSRQSSEFRCRRETFRLLSELLGLCQWNSSLCVLSLTVSTSGCTLWRRGSQSLLRRISEGSGESSSMPMGSEDCHSSKSCVKASTKICTLAKSRSCMKRPLYFHLNPPTSDRPRCSLFACRLISSKIRIQSRRSLSDLSYFTTRLRKSDLRGRRILRGTTRGCRT